MGWIHLNGELWQVTGDEARLQVRLAAPDAGCPRQSWTWDLFQMVKVENPAPGQRKSEGFIQIEVSDLYFYERDWRRLSGLEIRADAAWHDAREYVSEYGRLDPAHVLVNATLFGQPDAAGGEEGTSNWIAHDFILRFGTLDGWCLPCELDAWLIPRDDYHRKTPETPEAVARFAQGPPNLRVMTRTIFQGGSVEVPRCPGGDPVPWAQRLLREETGCETLHQPEVEWILRQMPDQEEARPMPGWRSTVAFSTRIEE